MPHRTRYSAMMVTITYAALLSMSPTTAGAWKERMTGTIGSFSPTSRTAVIEAPRDGGGREVRGGQGMSISLCISGVILGVLLGLLGYRVLQEWQGHKERQRAIDRITEQFQALFRERSG